MARLRPRQTSFSAGEWSPRLGGHVDLAKYAHACDTLENFSLLHAGAAQRRSGTRFVAKAGSPTSRIRLVPFQFSTEQAYVLEAGPLYLRFFANSGQVVSGTTPVSVVTTYTQEELAQLRWDQSADVLLLAHPSHALARLDRLSHTAWRLRDVVFDVPPSLEFGARPAATVTPSATSGAGVTFTASAASFLNSDVGRVIEVTGGASLGAKATITGFTSTTVVTGTITEVFASTAAVASGSWKITESPKTTLTPSVGGPTAPPGTAVTLTLGAAGWRDPADLGKFVHVNGGTVEVTGVTSTTVATGTIRGELTGTTVAPSGAWSLEENAFSTANGFPSVVKFLPNDRLLLANTRAQPTTLWLSKVSDYFNFGLGVLDDDAIQRTLNTRQVNAIRWAHMRGKTLFLGTSGAEFSASAQTGVLTPDDMEISEETTWGSSAVVPPIPVGNAILFVTATERQVRELVFSLEDDSLVAPDLLLLAEHLTRPQRVTRTVGLVSYINALSDHRILELAYQREPISTIWAIRADGTMPVCTYLRDQDAVGWSRYVTGAA